MKVKEILDKSTGVSFIQIIKEGQHDNYPEPIDINEVPDEMKDLEVSYFMPYVYKNNSKCLEIEIKDNIPRCEYCDTNKYKSTYYGEADFDMELELSDGDWVHLYMLWNSKNNKFGMYASGEGEAVTSINFCPRCGRKL